MLARGSPTFLSVDDTNKQNKICFENGKKNPKTSTRRNGLDTSKSTFNRIVKNDLKYHAYKIHVRHELLEPDLPRRLNFANWFLQKKMLAS